MGENVIPDDNMKNTGELQIEARVENLPHVLHFIGKQLRAAGCSLRKKMQIDLAVEEIFVNIASYAYRPDTGPATIRIGMLDHPDTLVITFLDEGRPFDPVSEKDPDLNRPLSERKIGGLGVYLTKKLMDGVEYEYKDGMNILTVMKEL